MSRIKRFSAQDPQNYRCQNRKEYKGKTNSYSAQSAGPVQQPDCVGVETRGRGAEPVLPWSTLQLPPFPTPRRAWGKSAVCGCHRAGTTARGCRSEVKGGPGAPSALTQIVPNLSSLYTLFSSVIYNSVAGPKRDANITIFKK